MCNKHYLAQYRRTNTQLCSFCHRPSIAKGMCAAHYSRASRGIDQTKPLARASYYGAICKQPGCSSPARSLELCLFHYARFRDGVPLDAPPRIAKGKFTNSYGYVQIVNPDRTTVLEHRHLMAISIGRALLPHETVHHKNGNRSDNRLVRGHELRCPGTCCNLELWSKQQPAGQRVADKLVWARELLRLYGDMFPEEPRRKPKQRALKV